MARTQRSWRFAADCHIAYAWSPSTVHNTSTTPGRQQGDCAGADDEGAPQTKLKVALNELSEFRPEPPKWLQ